MKSTREIDRRAQDILRYHIPPSWLIREQHPDIHIDYFIEVANSKGPTGPNVGIQLKGTRSPQYSAKHIKIPIKTKHLSYYLNKVKEPIFIIVVDVNKKEGYWIFIQEWLKERIKKDSERHKEIVVAIPIHNTISNIKRLHEAIVSAEIYMRDLWPSSIPAAVDHEKRLLEKIDPRINADVSFMGGKTAVCLRAKEDFIFNIYFKYSNDIKDRFEEFFDTGRSIEIDRSEIVESSGFPLLEHTLNKMQDGKMVIGSANRVKTNIIIATIGAEANEKVVLYGVDGYTFHGGKKVCFEGGLEDSPLRLSFNFPIPPPFKIGSLMVDFRFDSLSWDNIPILDLPYYDKIRDFFESIIMGDKIRIDCEIKGKKVFTATSHGSVGPEFMMKTLNRLRLLEKMRRISQKVKINPQYPKYHKFTEQEIFDIFMLDYLISSSEHRQSGEGVRFSFPLRVDNPFLRVLIDIKKTGRFDPLTIEPLDQKFSILGKEFEFAPLRYMLTNPILETSVESIQESIEREGQDYIEVSWCGGPSSEIIVSIRSG